LSQKQDRTHGLILATRLKDRKLDTLLSKAMRNLYSNLQIQSWEKLVLLVVGN